MENTLGKEVPHFFRLVLPVVLSLAWGIVCAQTVVVPAGEGTEESPYQITRLGHLVWMGATVSESAGKQYRLMNDIDASETSGWGQYDAYGGFAGFSPIGNDWEETCYFRGVFNGDGHVIRGLYMDCRSSGGLFGVVAGEGRVVNLGLVYTWLRGDVLGGVVGLNFGGAISNCWVSGCLRGGNVGGIVGNCHGGSVSRCYASGVFASQSGGRIGGIVGYFGDSSVVEECYADALLVGDYRGGVVYSMDFESSVSNSYWNVEASATINSGGGEGRTSEEMRQAATYAGWDFTNVWGIVEGACTPYLKMFPPPFTLNVVTQGLGRIAITPLKTAYEPGEQVTLTASSSAPGYVFSHWIGGESNHLTTVATVKMTGHPTVKAVFVEATDISTVDELQAIGDLAGNYRLTQDIDATATTNWNSGAGFAPIGGTFTGIFDGNGHVIKGLTINRPGQSGIGLFHDVESGGSVRRVGLEGGSVQGGNWVGALAGYADAGVFEECFATCDVSGTGAVGGLLGFAWSMNTFTRMIKCFATGNVVALSSDTWGSWRAGGLVGLLDHGVLEDCYAMGDVSCDNNAGGLVGESTFYHGDNYNTLRRCFATGAVTGRIGVGGLIGEDGWPSLIRGCFSTGVVKGNSDVGGLIGYGGAYIISQDDSSWVTDIGESYAMGLLIRIDGHTGVLTGGNDLYWNPTAYWNRDTTLKMFSNSDPQGKTTAQMKRQVTYEGWDFNATWAIEEGVSYPYLRGIGTPFLLHVVGEGRGHIIVTPVKAFYAPGEVVSLTAVVDSETNMFVRWVGSVADVDAPSTTVAMDVHKTVTAVFAVAKDIASIDELQKIGNDALYPAAGNYRLVQDIDASCTTNWNDGAGFLPLLFYDSAGSIGVIDGQRHVVRGLTINRPLQEYVGLIGVLGVDEIVRNIGLNGCSIIGGSLVGGAVGVNAGGTLERVFVDGAVCGTSEVGGVVGRNEGDIKRCYASGTVTATNTAGGLVGKLSYGGGVSESYAVSKLFGESSVGGLVGSVSEYAGGVVTSAYWDVAASGCAVSAVGEGKTTEEMRQQATYAGWDFSTEWGIDEGAGYPFLWQFRLTLPSGVNVPGMTNQPGYAVWAAAHTNAWGTADFSGVPTADFETAWLLDLQPATGLATGTGFEVRLFEVGESEIRVSLALTASGAAKQGSVNGWLAVEAKSDLSDGWTVIAAQQAGDDRIAFTDGLATVTFTRPEGYHFFRPVLRPSRTVAATPVYQASP